MSNDGLTPYLIFKGDYEIYCPRCDMFFNNRQDYQDHLLIRQFKESVLDARAQRSLDRGAYNNLFNAFMHVQTSRFDKKVKFVEKINAVQETDNLDDLEFHDTVGFQFYSSSSIIIGSFFSTNQIVDK